MLETEFAQGHYGYNRLIDSDGLVGDGVIPAADYDAILAEMHHLASEGRYFYSLTSYIYLGRRCSSAWQL